MSDGDFGDFDIQAGGGAIFTTTAAHALKQTLEAVANQDEQRQFLASVTQEYPRWMQVRNVGSTEITFHQQAAMQESAWKYLGGGMWALPPAHDERPAAPVAAVKRCTCGGESVGGGHSHWCDIDG